MVAFYYVDKLTVCTNNCEKAGNDVINILTQVRMWKMHHSGCTTQVLDVVTYSVGIFFEWCIFHSQTQKPNNNSKAKDKGNHAPWRVWISGEKLLVFASLISPSKSVCLRSYIKHSSQCFITISKTLKFVKNTPLRIVFSTVLSVFDMWWNTVSRVWYNYYTKKLDALKVSIVIIIKMCKLCLIWDETLCLVFDTLHKILVSIFNKAHYCSTQIVTLPEYGHTSLSIRLPYTTDILQYM